MSALNLSVNGPSIQKSYQSIVDAPPPSGPAAVSPTYGQWAVFSVSAPLLNAFESGGNKESVLKVQSTGEGELLDLIDEFSDGRIQFAYVKLKDSNTGLPKNALIAWCGEGVPERTKGYFTSHMTAVAKLLHGYHVQITARSDRDLTPESIIQKVADASGSKYSAGTSQPPPVATTTKPSTSTKPAFTPTQSFGVGVGTRPLATRTSQPTTTDVDEDGWGADAPPVTRTQLEKVKPAYQPTTVNMSELTSPQSALSANGNNTGTQPSAQDVVKGSYVPVGKVDIAAIRRQAQEDGNLKDDRPEIVKGSYEPIGKVDIAAIRARAQNPDTISASQPIAASLTGQSEEREEASPSMAQRSAAFSSSPLTSLPKPKVVNKFGSNAAFSGTKAPVPGGFDAKSPAPSTAPVGVASRTFADQGGKTPAQIWAEKKARERGTSGSGAGLPPSSFTGQSPMAQQTSGGQWESGYSGKKWAPVDTKHAEQPRLSTGQDQTSDIEPENVEEATPSGGIGSIRDRFAGAAPMGAPASFDRPTPAPAPEPEASTKPNRGIPIPGLPVSVEPAASTLPPPPAQPRSPTPPTPAARDISPIRIARPVGTNEVTDVHEQQISPPPVIPVGSLSNVVQAEDDEPERGQDHGRTAAQVAAINTVGEGHIDPQTNASQQGERAKAEYDYEMAEENEVSLQEGDIVTDIEKLDPDWWLVTNPHGQRGLVPANYLSLLEDEEPAAVAQPPTSTLPTTTAAPPSDTNNGGTARALFDYEAAEDNELSFAEGALITNIQKPDVDWWYGESGGHEGLFPSNYVEEV